MGTRRRTDTKEADTPNAPQRTHRDFDFSGGSAVDRLSILFVFLKISLSNNDKKQRIVLGPI